MPGQVHVIDHPLVQHKLTLMRMKSTSTSAFRNLLDEISMLLAYEVTRDLPTARGRDRDAARPDDARRCSTARRSCWSRSCAPAPASSTACCAILPSARVGHIGLYRDPKTLGAVEYYFKVPGEMPDRDAIVVDPMLATGNSAVAAVDRVQGHAAHARSSSSAC